MAQNRRGVWAVTSGPMASSTGRARVTPPNPLRNARRSSRKEPGIDASLLNALLLQEHLAVRRVQDHVPHPVPRRLQLQGVLLQVAQFIVREAAAGSIDLQMLEHAERDLIDPI